jgi:hypothetical protein
MTAQSIERPRTKIRVKTTKRKQIAALKIAGVTERNISTILDIPKTTIHQIIHRTFTKEEIEAFETQEARILSDKRAMILSAIDHDDIKGASLKDKGIVYGIMVEKGRLIDGNSTANIAIAIDITDRLAQALKAGKVIAPPTNVTDSTT